MTQRCAIHPERDAQITCSRCGSFACDECTSDGSSICKPCSERLGRHRLIAHVPVLGIVMIVHGVFLAGWGLFMAAYVVFYLFEMASLPAPPGDPGTEDAISSLIVLVFLALAFLHLLPGALQIFAGWRIRSFQGRGLAIGALIASFFTVFGCYCGLTSVGIAIWGLVVLFHEEVARRFAMPGASANAGDP